MMLINPTTMTDATLLSSSVAEDDFAEWNAATNYTIGAKVIRLTTHRIYESIVGGVDATPPENATGGETPKWLEIGPTNRWAMFDDVVGTVTTSSTSIVVVLQAGSAGGIAALELIGETLVVSIKDQPGGSVVFEREVDLDGSQIDSVFDWFFAEREQRTDVVLTSLPTQFPDQEISITITPYSGVAAVGVCKIGLLHVIGSTQYNATVSLEDYSRKVRDEFGRYEIVERSWSKKTRQRVVTDPIGFNRIYRLLASVRAKPCVWLASDEQRYQPLVVYGFYRTFEIDVAYHALHYCSLEIEGLI